MFKSWKTSLAGALVIVGALATAGKCMLDGGAVMSCLVEQWPAIAAGFGLLFAKDKNVTGGTVQQ